MKLPEEVTQAESGEHPKRRTHSRHIGQEKESRLRSLVGDSGACVEALHVSPEWEVCPEAECQVG